jgi:L-asparaginase
VVEVLQKDSLEIDDADRARIAEIVAAESAARIVITHGTDTMTKTAQALHGIEGKTIAFVGAWLPARFAESDAAFNLGMAFACVQLAAPGIYVAMNGSVFPASDVVKDRGFGSFVAKDSGAA